VSSYTQRINWLRAAKQGTLKRSYEVPENHRVVIKCIAMAIGGVADSGCAVVVHGYSLIIFQPPAANSTRFDNLTLVVYERETVQIVAWGSDASCMISGYIFKDDTGPIGAPGPIEPALAKPSPLDVEDLAA
jgi:hypothetical protein